MSYRWRSRPATSADARAILELFNEVFNQKRSIDHWKWKFLDNPTNSICIFVAEDSRYIVGQYAILPTQMNLQGEKIMGAQSLDTMTHSAYRKQGMFVSLAEQCFTQATSQNIGVLYGSPNEQSYPGFVNRLGWHDLGKLPQLVKILDPKAIISRRTKSTIIATIAEKPASLLLKLWKGDSRPKSSEHVKIKNIDTFDAHFDALWVKIKGKLPVSVWKDSNYLNWRYVSCPDTNYTILAAEENNTLVGFIVLKCGAEQNHNGYIVDFLCLPERATAAALLIRDGLDYLRRQGMYIAVCHMLEHSPFYQLFTSHGFFKYGDGLRLIVRLNMPSLPSSILLNYEQWYLVEGDFDTF
jgi:hypothetical protein